VIINPVDNEARRKYAHALSESTRRSHQEKGMFILSAMMLVSELMEEDREHPALAAAASYVHASINREWFQEEIGRVVHGLKDGEVRFDKGMPMAVKTTTKRWLKHGKRVIKRAPLISVNLTDVVPADVSGKLCLEVDGTGDNGYPSQLAECYPEGMEATRTVEKKGYHLIFEDRVQVRAYVGITCIEWARKQAGMPPLQRFVAAFQKTDECRRELAIMYERMGVKE